MRSPRRPIGLLIGPKVSVILPQAIYRHLLEAATELRVTVEALLREAADAPGATASCPRTSATGSLT